MGKTLGVRFQPSSVMLYAVSFYKCFHTFATYIPRFDGYIYKLSLAWAYSYTISPVICGFIPAQALVGKTLGVRFQVGSFRLLAVVFASGSTPYLASSRWKYIYIYIYTFTIIVYKHPDAQPSSMSSEPVCVGNTIGVQMQICMTQPGIELLRSCRQ